MATVVISKTTLAEAEEIRTIEDTDFVAALVDLGIIPAGKPVVLELWAAGRLVGYQLIRPEDPPGE